MADCGSSVFAPGCTHVGYLFAGVEGWSALVGGPPGFILAASLDLRCGSTGRDRIREGQARAGEVESRASGNILPMYYLFVVFGRIFLPGSGFGGPCCGTWPGFFPPLSGACRVVRRSSGSCILSPEAAQSGTGNVVGCTASYPDYCPGWALRRGR